MKVAILGAGSGGVSAAVELSRTGHIVRLWNRSGKTLEPFIDAGGIRYEGVMGSGIAAHFANARIPVVLFDIKMEYAEGAIAKM